MSEKGDLYLLIATWQNESNEYRKRCIHTRASSPEEMYEIWAKENPEWRTCQDATQWGDKDLKHWTSVHVYKTCAYYPDDRWHRWRREQREKREEEIKQEKKARDMKEMRRIIDEWGLSPLELLAAMDEE